MIGDIAASDMERAVDDVSEGGRFVFTRAQLLYELERAGLLPAAGDPVSARSELIAELGRWEERHQPIPGMVRPEQLPTHADLSAIPADVSEYSVPRALVFADRELCQAFVLNGFHRKIEVAPVTVGYPDHVWSALLRQVNSGFETRFLLVRDASAAGYGLADQVQQALPPEGAEIVDLGMTLSWGFRLRLSLRRGAAQKFGENVPQRDRSLLAKGCYLELSALAAGPLLRWVYEMIGDQAEDAGFG
ncbi:MAG TPA: hypothetical protein PKA88_26860 [Polyangiaceae bacterium]|nr:hypothetical protein [Polyangiaceae bacterium]